MAKRYPQEVKDEAAALYAEGLSTHKIGQRLGVSQQTVYRWVTPKGQAYTQAYFQSSEWKERQKRYNKVYYADPEIRAREKERQKAYNKVYYADPEIKRQRNERLKDRYATDPAFRIRVLLGSRTRCALKGNVITKSASTEELLGISPLELARLWTSQYGPGWRVSPDLHIDHIRPCASFNLLDPTQQRLCFNYRNLQLLSAAENRSKGDSWTEEMERAWTEKMHDSGWEGELFPVFR